MPFIRTVRPSLKRFAAVMSALLVAASFAGCCCKVAVFDHLIDDIADKEPQLDCLYPRKLDISRYQLYEPPRSYCSDQNACRSAPCSTGSQSGDSCR